MPRPRTYRTEALVLKRAPLAEADLLISLYTPHMGKLRVIAHSVRRLTSHMVGHLEPLTRVDLSLAHGRNMDSVNQAQVLESYAPLKADLDMVSHGIYVSELLDSFGVEGSANLTLYDLTCEALRLLGRKETNKGLLLRYFELQTLKLSGFLPELHVCVVCRNRPAVEMTFFSPDGGGLVCGDCRPEGMRLLPLVSGTVEMLRFLETAEPTHAARFSTSAEVQVQLKAVLAATVRYWLDREMRSAAFLDTARDALSQPSEGTDHA